MAHTASVCSKWSRSGFFFFASWPFIGRDTESVIGKPRTVPKVVAAELAIFATLCGLASLDGHRLNGPCSTSCRTGPELNMSNPGTSPKRGVAPSRFAWRLARLPLPAAEVCRVFNSATACHHRPTWHDLRVRGCFAEDRAAGVSCGRLSQQIQVPINAPISFLGVRC